MRYVPAIIWCQGLMAVVCLAGLAPLAHAADRKPNIVCILVDDLGYADLSCQGSEDVLTPHIDSIAFNGVRFTDGYVTAPQCSPSRAGTLTGRYQNRFGFERNFARDTEEGLSVSEPTIAERLQDAGYATGMVGKWHLGEAEPFRPYNRGFEETFWHPTGGYLLPDQETGVLPGVFRGPDPVEVREYSTDALTNEAMAFIDRHRSEPFFLYAAYIPPHWPMEAKPEHLQRFAHVEDLHRRTFLAMMAALDENVGRLLEKLREHGIEEQTLLFFLSDNGGPTGKTRPEPDAPFQFGRNTSLNAPCRGWKGNVLEGGIRVPCLVQWRGRIPAGKVYTQPVISLDVLPTALAAAGVAIKEEWNLDGVDLLPFLTGEQTGVPHERLFWRFNGRSAVREGNWKLVRNGGPPELYDLSHDIGESCNLVAEHPERAAGLERAWQDWNAELPPPAW